MTSRSKTIWDESPVERVLMKLYRVPPVEAAEWSVESELAASLDLPRKSPQEIRAAARQELQRELTRSRL
jgi:hypothetical protein